MYIKRGVLSLIYFWHICNTVWTVTISTQQLFYFILISLNWLLFTSAKVFFCIYLTDLELSVQNAIVACYYWIVSYGNRYFWWLETPWTPSGNFKFYIAHKSNIYSVMAPEIPSSQILGSFFTFSFVTFSSNWQLCLDLICSHVMCVVLCPFSTFIWAFSSSCSSYNWRKLGVCIPTL